jgi:hypothetical protein
MWQIVVAGNMDPRQHVPQWYQLIGCINSDETKAGVATFGLGVQSEFLFDVGAFAISVDAHKWTISSIHPENRARMVQIASVVFDRLKELAIPAYGINRWIILKPGMSRPDRIVANMIAEAAMGFSRGEATCQIDFRKTEDKFETYVKVAPSVIALDELVVIYNRHHPIPPQSGYYDVGPMIQRDAEPAWQAADEYGHAFSERLKGASEAHHG